MEKSMSNQTTNSILILLFICAAQLPSVGIAQSTDDPWPDLPVSLNGELPEPTGGFLWRKGAEKQVWHNCIGIDPRLKDNWKPENFFDDPKVIKLCDAIFDGDVEEMERLIQDGADVNAKGDCRMNPLYWAFHLNTDPRPFGCLMKHGADPNIIVDMSTRNEIQAVYPGYSVTHLSARGVYNRHFKTVFENGGDPNLMNECPFDNWRRQAFFELWWLAPDANERLQLMIENGVDLNLPSPRGPSYLIANSCSNDQRCELALLALEQGNVNHLASDKPQRGEFAGCHLRAIHYLAYVKEKRKIDKQAGEYPNFHKLVARLEELGESMEEAEADLARWKKWKEEGRMDLIENEYRESIQDNK